MLFRRRLSHFVSPFMALALVLSVLSAPYATAQEQAAQATDDEPPIVVTNVEEASEEQVDEQQDERAEAASVVIEDPEQASNAFVIYLMRHAEKEDTEIDPELTRDGYRRADGLAQMLKNAGIEAIYSTYYRRSVGTALPLARELAVPVQFYQADDAEAMLEALHTERKNALVIGHSNTVPSLLESLGIEYPSMSEDEYGDLFQVFVAEKDPELSDQGRGENQYIHLTAPLIMSTR